MKAVIDMVKYDTDTAEEVAEAGYGYAGDFEHYSESLYRTKNGSWFLAGSGGPRSHYSRQTGQNEWSGSSRITPLSEGQAAEWLEQHREVKALEEHFSHLISEA